jgi:UDP-glucose:tetrahydrobiopterin glucosyltransferase
VPRVWPHAGGVRVALVAPLVTPIDEDREQMGGAQAVLADLARGLAKRGHEVSVAAANGSHLTGVEIPPLGIDSSLLRPAALGDAPSMRTDDAEQARAFAMVRAWLTGERWRWDVVHAHAYDAPAFTTLVAAPRPVVHTLHLPPSDAGVVSAALRARDAVMVTVSEANARAWRAKGVPVGHVVHNGIAVERITVGRHRAPYLLYAGRISPEKGVHIAIALARRLGRPLLIVGSVYDQAYFDELVAPQVRPLLDWRSGDDVEGIMWIGARRREEVHAIMGGAAVTVMPVRWEEPFGLVAVESLAAGTPVVGFRRGGLGEIVDETCGALADPDDERALDDAVRHALTRSPDACRRRAERFSLDAMLDGYERIFTLVRAAPDVARDS